MRRSRTPALRRVGWAFAAAVVGAFAVPLSAAAAGQADVTDGPCPPGAPKSVTIVVDFQQLGGDSVVRCVTNLEGSGGRPPLSYDALIAAELAPVGTNDFGPAFVCRLLNRPAPGEKIPLSYNPDYVEDCHSTPPTAAHWGYWWAAPGDTSWTLGRSGATHREVQYGGYEGWSFALNAPGNSNPPPRMAPPIPRTTTSAAAARTAERSSEEAAAAGPTEPNSEATAAARTAERSSEEAAAAHIGVAGAAVSDQGAGGGGTGWTTAVTIGVIVAAAAGAIAVARRRRIGT